MRIPFSLRLPKDFGLHSGRKYKNTIKIEVFNNRDEMKLISSAECHNIVTDEGLDADLDIMFHGSTQITTWYCLIFEDDITPDGDETYAIPGVTEWEAYDEGTRPEWTEAAASSQSITNSANKATFTANASKTLHGAGLVGGGSAASTKGNTAGGGTLFNLGQFDSSQPVVDDNVVNLTITLTAADDGA